LAILIQKEPVEGEVNLQDREMFEIFFYAINGEDFFDKVLSGDYFGTFGYPPLIGVSGINLSDPAGIAIAGRPYEDMGMEIAKMEGFRMALGDVRHGFSLDEKRGLLKWIEDGLGKTGYLKHSLNF